MSYKSDIEIEITSSNKDLEKFDVADKLGIPKSEFIKLPAGIKWLNFMKAHNYKIIPATAIM